MRRAGHVQGGGDEAPGAEDIAVALRSVRSGSPPSNQQRGGAAALARARGIPLAAAAARDFLQQVAKASAEHYPSVVFDLRQKRLTEIDSFNTAIVRGSAQLGLDASANQTMVALVKTIESHFSTVRH